MTSKSAMPNGEPENGQSPPEDWKKWLRRAPTKLLLLVWVSGLLFVGVGLMRPTLRVVYSGDEFPYSLVVEAPGGSFVFEGHGEHGLLFPRARGLSLTAGAAQTVVVPSANLVGDRVYVTSDLRHDSLMVSDLITRASELRSLYQVELYQIPGLPFEDQALTLVANHESEPIIRIEAPFTDLHFQARGVFERIELAGEFELTLARGDTSLAWTVRPLDAAGHSERAPIGVQVFGVEAVTLEGVAYPIRDAGVLILDSTSRLQNAASPRRVALRSWEYELIYFAGFRTLQSESSGDGWITVGAGAPVQASGPHQMSVSLSDGRFVFRASHEEGVLLGSLLGNLQIDGWSNRVVWQGQEMIPRRWRTWPEPFVGGFLLLVSSAFVLWWRRVRPLDRITQRSNITPPQHPTGDG